MKSEMTYMEALLGALVIGLFVALMSVIGEQDYQDALAEERTICLMVAQGHWPTATAEGYDCPKRLAEALVKRIQDAAGASYE